jgi:hypothetical protein
MKLLAHDATRLRHKSGKRPTKMGEMLYTVAPLAWYGHELEAA